VADAGSAGHLDEPPVELVGRLRIAVLVTEHEVVVVPGLADWQTFFPRLASCIVSAAIVRLEMTNGASSMPLASSLSSSRPSCKRHERQVASLSSADTSGDCCVRVRLVSAC
jgi:hypothetical protein